MSSWLKRLIAVLQIGGGFMGILLAFQALTNGEKDPLYIGINLIFAFFFGIGIVAGVTLLEGMSSGLPLSKIYQLIQLPVIASPYAQYSFGSGFFGALYFNSNGFNGSFELGSRSLFLLVRETQWNFGVNIVAVFFLVCLMTMSCKSHKQAKNKSMNMENSDANNSPVYSRRSKEPLCTAASDKN